MVDPSDTSAYAVKVTRRLLIEDGRRIDWEGLYGKEKDRRAY